MREPPGDLSASDLIESLRRDYGLDVSAVTFLPLGHDSQAWVYRAETNEGASYFVKARRSLDNRAGLVVPHLLNEPGVTEVVAPIATTAGQLSATCAEYVLIVYPFVTGETGLHGGMTRDQWVHFGRALRAVHDIGVTPDLDAVLGREGFVPEGAEMIRTLDSHVAAGVADDELANAVVELWGNRREVILSLLDTAEDLGRRLRGGQRPLVVCHADAHTNNVLIDPRGRVHLVDWDGVVLAPRERDLMFVIGGIGVDFVRPHEEAAFFRGYGPIEVDQLALAFYRYAWAVSDIASYGEQVLLRPDLGLADRTEGVVRLDSLFGPGEIVDIALGSRF